VSDFKKIAHGFFLLPKGQTMSNNLQRFQFLRSGKVRDVYVVADSNFLLIVASDRISAFDHVLPDIIPNKGQILTKLSNYWFEITRHIIANHLVNTDPLIDRWTDHVRWRQSDLKGRSVLVKKAQPLKIEAIVRGYLAGSGWKDYLKTGHVCGILLPKGLREGDKLPEPIFTPSTKAEGGAHDENISFSEAKNLVGADVAQQVRDASLALYEFAETHARKRGVIIADTKFEFGITDEGLILIDELFTPDSSRFWPVSSYLSGSSPLSFDKQFVRDYLEEIRWNKRPPVPPLPSHIVFKTAEKYKEALKSLTDTP
jgi:phosphoribosylaminoimidazole-succinocarboxamide synthase